MPGSRAGAIARSISSVSVAPQTPVTAHLGVGDDGARHRRVGGGVDVGVAEPLGMREHRHPRLALHPLDQGFSAARDDQVEQPGGGEHGGDIGAVGSGGDLHAGVGQAGGAQPGGAARR